jgi:hypothetical protein
VHSGNCCVSLRRAAGGRISFVEDDPVGAASGGGEYFDYITADAAARRVYLSQGTKVKVVDADSGALLGTITGLKRCHGVALVPELGRGFISDGDAAQTIIFDLQTLKQTGQLKGEADADSIIYDPASKRVFVFNGEPKSATVIDRLAEPWWRPFHLAALPSKPSPMARERSTTISKTPTR